jgi:hypothetical protein
MTRTTVAAVASELSLQPVEASPASVPLPEGPGWFDSSWILRAGLEVREGWPGDAAPSGWFERWFQPAAGGVAGLSLSAT